ncbi:hypothetical protein DCC62_01630 [candidate division KSB1 bacterium]|nr:MAG: hypothetical protein DCC62_01630 [candidate division KSB1 bacterium]
MRLCKNRLAEQQANSNFPLFPLVGVIGLVPDEWASIWQSRQHVLSRLSVYFNVVWVNPAKGWRELWFRNSLQNNNRFHHDFSSHSFMVHDPGKWLPHFYRPRFIADCATQMRLNQAYRILRKKKCDKFILYLWRPEFSSALEFNGYDLSCYHIDDEYTFSDIEQPLAVEEKSLIARVDQVIIHSPALLEKKGRINPHTTLIPNGVDYDAYATPVDELDETRHIPHPRIGYVGVIKKQLDLSLLHTLVMRHQEWSFIFVGPMENLFEQTSTAHRLAAMPNVYFLGSKPVHRLPAYTQHLDVCLLCYQVNGYTKFIYPMKLHEYLATGRPVVASPIRSLQDYAHIITLASTVDEWSQALSDALQPAEHSPEKLEARRCIARQHDWNNLVQQIAYSLCKHFGSSYTEQFQKIPNHTPVCV